MREPIVQKDSFWGDFLNALFVRRVHRTPLPSQPEHPTSGQTERFKDEPSAERETWPSVVAKQEVPVADTSTASDSEATAHGTEQDLASKIRETREELGESLESGERETEPEDEAPGRFPDDHWGFISENYDGWYNQYDIAHSGMLFDLDLSDKQVLALMDLNIGASFHETYDRANISPKRLDRIMDELYSATKTTNRDSLLVHYRDLLKREFGYPPGRTVIRNRLGVIKEGEKFNFRYVGATTDQERAFEAFKKRASASALSRPRYVLFEHKGSSPGTTFSARLAPKSATRFPSAVKDVAKSPETTVKESIPEVMDSFPEMLVAFVQNKEGGNWIRTRVRREAIDDSSTESAHQESVEDIVAELRESIRASEKDSESGGWAVAEAESGDTRPPEPPRRSSK